MCLVLGQLAFDLQNVKDNETRKEEQKLVGGEDRNTLCRLWVVHVFLFNVAGRRLATLNRKKAVQPQRRVSGFWFWFHGLGLFRV